MIGLDTSVLVRYLTQDDPGQSRRATQLFEKAFSDRRRGFISQVVLVETVWVLKESYGCTDGTLATTIEALLASDQLLIESEHHAFTAMVALKEGRGSFADALIGARALEAGCDFTATFDRKATRLPGFVELP